MITNRIARLCLRTDFRLARERARRVLAAAIFSAPLLVSAATFTWSGNGADNNWTTGLNWAGTAPGSGQALVFAGSTRLTPNNNNATFTVTSITFNNTAGAFVIGGNAFTVSGGITNNDANLQTINNTLSISASQTFSAASGSLAFANINLSTTTTARTLTFSAANDISVSGVIANGVASSGSITKTGVGTLTLLGANTYSGTTTLTAGTLAVGSNTALGTSTLSLNGGTLAASGAARTLSNTVNLAASSTIGGTQDLTLSGAFANTSGSAATLTINNSGYTTLGSTVGLSNRVLTVAGTGDATFSGVVSGTGGLTFTNTGTLLLAGANTYSGTTTVSAGSGTLLAGSDTAFGTGTLAINGGTIGGSGTGLRTLGNAITLGASATIGGTQDLTFTNLLTQTVASTLTVNNSGTTEFGAIDLSANNTARVLTFGGTGNVNVTGVIANGGTGAGGVVQSGSGTLALTGTNTYSGNTTATSGTLAIGNNAALGTSTLQLDGGTVIASGGARSVTNSVSFTNATGTIAGANDLTFTGTVTNAFAGNVTLVNNNTATTTLGAINLSNSATSRTLTFDGTGATLVNGVIANGGASTAGNIIKAGTGTLTLSGANTYGGTTTISAGTLSAASIVVSGGSSNLGNATSAVVLGDSTNTGTLSYTGTSATFTRGFTVNAGGGALEVATAGQTLTLATGGIATSGDFAVTGAGNVTVNSQISGAGSVTMSGAGTLTLANANNYSGGTLLNTSTGTLAINHSSAVGTGTLTIASGTVDNTTGGAITLAGNNSQNWNGDFTFAGTQDLNLGTGGVTLNSTPNVTVAAGTLTVGGVISGSGLGLTKSGSGTLALTGTNSSYTGATTLNAGTLQVASLANGGSNSSIGASSNVATNLMLNGGTLQYTGSGSTTDRLFTLGTAGVTIDSAGSGAVVFNNSGSLGLNGSGARTLTLAGSADGSLAAVIGESGGTTSVTKNGAGTWTLNGSSSNTYTGTTSVTAGTLALAKSGSATAVSGNVDISGTGTVRLDANTQFATNTAVSLGAGASPTLNLNGSSTTVGSIASTNTAANIAFGAASTNTLTVGNATSTTYSGALTGGSSTANFVKQGTGTLTLNGTSTYAGLVTVSGGVLNAGSNTALGTGNVTVNTGTTLQLQGSGISVGSGASTVTLNGSGTGLSGNDGALINVGGGTTRLNNNVALGTNTTISSGSTSGATLIVGGTPPAYVPGVSAPDTNTVALGANKLTFVGASGTTTQVDSDIQGTGAVDVNTAGTVVFNANKNTYTGTTSVLNGTLTVQTANNAFAPHSSGTSFYGVNGPLVIGDGSGSANSAVVKLNAATNAISSTVAISIFSDGLLNLNGSSQNIGKLTMTGGNIDTGSGTLYLDYANTSVDITPTATSGTATINGTVSLTYWKDAATEGTNPNQVRTFNVGHDSSNTSDLTINALMGNGGIIKTGTGTMTLATSNNTYEGATTVNNGILNVRVGTESVSGANRSSLGVGDDNGGTGAGTTVNSGGTLQLQGGIAITHEHLVLNGSGYNSLGALNNLSGSNTWGGGGSSGTIALGSNASAVSSAGLLTINTAISSSGTGYGLTVGGAGNTTISGTIGTGSTGSVTKTDGGTLILSGTNTYQGATNINTGVVSVQNNFGLGAVSTGSNGTFVTGGAELQLSSAANGNLAIGGEALTISGAGIGGTQGALHNVAGSNSFGGLVTLGSTSTIMSDAGTTLTLSGGTSSANYGLTITGAGSTVISGNISNGTGSLTKAGSGSLTFAGTVNGTTGAVGAAHLNAGTMTVGNGTQTTTLNTGAFDSAVSTTLLIASGGTVVANYASGSTTFSGALAGSGTFDKTGAGTLVFDHSFNASNLTLTLGGGTLSLMNGGYTFGTIHITGNTVLDFNNSAGTFLSSGALIIDAGVTVTVNNWTAVANNASLSTVWYATNTVNSGTLGGTSISGGTPLNQIVFTNYNGMTTTWVSGTSNGWFDHEIRPTPEPATYGAIFVSGCLGLLGWRRYRRNRAGSTVRR